MIGRAGRRTGEPELNRRRRLELELTRKGLELGVVTGTLKVVPSTLVSPDLY